MEDKKVAIIGANSEIGALVTKELTLHNYVVVDGKIEPLVDKFSEPILIDKIYDFNLAPKQHDNFFPAKPNYIDGTRKQKRKRK